MYRSDMLVTSALDDRASGKFESTYWPQKQITETKLP